ncbi:hypothetical protein Syun_000080 [Stephania yunnanensis]|uniref:Disease resistance protein RPM1-like n=1 Tax=Stephania yunnanensis TaxID=152371 RepID=A0AAP0LE31_9MAGN
MAEAVVNLLIEQLGALLIEEATTLLTVRAEIQDIKAELERMLAFLRDADERSEHEEAVKAWVKQVRDLAYDTEDVLDDFFYTLSPNLHYSGFCSFVCQCGYFVHSMKARHRIASRAREIKCKVSDIAEMRARYQLNSNSFYPGSTSQVKRTWHDPRGNSLLLDDSEVVGLGEAKERLVGWLVESRKRVTVISVFGAGGLGKTTLVKKVCDDDKVKNSFRCFAWITVSQTFRIEELLRRILVQFYDSEDLVQNKKLLPFKLVESMDEAKLKETLKEYLQKKRYLIVFDDVWSSDAWVAIRYALPDSECGSRVMVTTRYRDIANYCIESHGYAYEPSTLNWGDAWTLFCRKAFKSTIDNVCPAELLDLSQKILKRCEGLPLAVVAIAGLLSTKENTVVEWSKAYKSLGSQLEKNPFLNDLKMILSLSYNDLPYRLKSCFLVFGVFPEDYSIKRTRLIRLWIAERFVQREDEMSEEEVGEGYLDELIKRSLIQVTERDCDGRVRSCRVHDILREFILLKAKEQNFCTICTDNMAPLLAFNKIRRISIHNDSCSNVLQNMDHNHTRSMFLFGKNQQLTPGLITPKKPFSSAFRYLKLLDFDNMPMKSFPTRLLFLRYLRLRSSSASTEIKRLPRSIGLLKNLETLDLKGTGIYELPVEILKLKNLRNLLLGYSVIEKYEFVSLRFTQGVKVPAGIRNLTALQKLAYVDAKQDGGMVVRELAMLTNMRRLGLVNLRIEDGKDLCASIQKMKHLESLFVTSVNVHKPKLWDMDLVDLHTIWTPLPLLDLQYLSTPPPLMQRLYLHGRLEKLPDWISSLGNLVRVHLMGSKLVDESYKGLGALPNLATLKLTDAYDGEFLCFEAGGFPKLQSLHLHRMGQLKTVVVEKGAMPCLREFETMFCMQLFLPIPGIEHLHHLNKFHFNSIV